MWQRLHRHWWKINPLMDKFHPDGYSGIKKAPPPLPKKPQISWFFPPSVKKTYLTLLFLTGVWANVGGGFAQKRYIPP
jgi:hypothetical protein